jgi:hypothetical protein
MKSPRNIADRSEIRHRAAEIRQGWTAAEKRRRMGLPPDAPRRIREFVLGSPQAWQLATYELRSAR